MRKNSGIKIVPLCGLSEGSECDYQMPGSDTGCIFGADRWNGEIVCANTQACVEALLNEAGRRTRAEVKLIRRVRDGYWDSKIN